MNRPRYTVLLNYLITGTEYNNNHDNGFNIWCSLINVLWFLLLPKYARYFPSIPITFSITLDITKWLDGTEIWRDVMLFRELAVMSRWVKEEPLSLCRRQGSVRHKLKSFMFIQWTRSSELQLLCKVDILYQEESCVNTDASYLSRHATLCHFYKPLPAFKMCFAFGRFLLHTFHDTALSQQ